MNRFGEQAARVSVPERWGDGAAACCSGQSWVSLGGSTFCLQLVQDPRTARPRKGCAGGCAGAWRARKLSGMRLMERLQKVILILLVAGNRRA